MPTIASPSSGVVARSGARNACSRQHTTSCECESPRQTHREAIVSRFEVPLLKLVDHLRIGVRVLVTRQVDLAVLGHLLARVDVRARVVVVPVGRLLAVPDDDVDVEVLGSGC
jgi:hypothetical protein